MSEPAIQAVAELGRQIGFISAFLGGVAATLLGTLLTLKSERKIVGATAICAAAAASAFILAVVVSPNLAGVGGSHNLAANLWLVTCAHGLGLFLLLACIGMAGWIRSRGAGIGSTIAAGVAAALTMLSVLL